jgi:hypothetical protein
MSADDPRIFRLLKCHLHGARKWQGHVMCNGCGLVFQTEEPDKSRFANPVCACGERLMPDHPMGDALGMHSSVSSEAISTTDGPPRARQVHRRVQRPADLLPLLSIGHQAQRRARPQLEAQGVEVQLMSTLNLLDWKPGPQVGALHETESARAEDRRARKAAARPKSVDQRYAEFAKANPHVFTELLRLATARLDRGETFISIKALWEELRTSLDLADDGAAPGAYKLNNNFTAIYARALIRAQPRLDGVIKVRERRAK